MMRRGKPVAVSVFFAVWMLAACSGASNGRSGSPVSRTTAAGVAGQVIDFSRRAPAAPIPGAVAGGTVTVLDPPNSWGARLLDPTVLYFDEPISVLSGLVTRSLTQYVYDPAHDSMVLIPDIATDTGTPNADFTSWTFTIRDGVRFENGATVTADDVAFGIERSLDRTDFRDGPAYSADFFLDAATYKGPYQSGTDYAGVVVDGNTVTIKMDRPFPDMPYWAAFPAMGPIPQIGSEPASYGLHPLATGPYKFSRYRPGKSLTLVRNRHWDPNTDPGRHAYPKRYVFRFQTPAERIDASVLGNPTVGQTALSTQSVLPADYPRAQRLNRLTLGPGPCTDKWFPDYRKITDIRVRKAIGYAYPYQAIDRALGAIPGVTALAGDSILPPGFPDRRNYTVLDIAPGHTDPKKAKSLLQQAGYAPGEYGLRFVYAANDPWSVRINNLRVQALQAAGFTVTPYRAANYDDLFKVEQDPDAPINIRSSGWCSDWKSGSTLIPPLFQSNSAANVAYFTEPVIDTEIERISRLPIDQQPQAWAALDQTIMTQYYPVIITGYHGDAFPHGSRIKDMNNDNILGMPTWKDINVAP
jgi:peptide/nickel transport system substrate-binding protein